MEMQKKKATVENFLLNEGDTIFKNEDFMTRGSAPSSKKGFLVEEMVKLSKFLGYNTTAIISFSQ